jgi:hypothetical protein
MLYLHEIIDIIGTGQEPYIKTVIERAEHSEQEGISRLMGCWKVIGSTNRWPRVVNLWEMDSWSHWAHVLERQFLPEKRDSALGPWWAKATEWRSGGFDRILEPTAFSPTRQQLLESNLRAWTFFHTIGRTQPGKRQSYFNFVEKDLRPAMEKAGAALFGAYGVPMRSDEVVVVWAAADFRTACDIFGSASQGSNLREVTHSESQFLHDCETMWLVPGEGSFLHP